MAMPMANGHKNEKARLPPKRGQVKVRIFRKFVELLVGVVSKPGRVLSRKKKMTADESDQPPLPHFKVQIIQKGI